MAIAKRRGEKIPLRAYAHTKFAEHYADTRAHPESRLHQEIGATLGAWEVLPIALVHAALSALRRRPLASFAPAVGDR